MPNLDARRESRLRRWADRLGLVVHKSRAGISVDNHGGYMLVDASINGVVAGVRFDLDLDDLEAWLVQWTRDTRA